MVLQEPVKRLPVGFSAASTETYLLPTSQARVGVRGGGEGGGGGKYNWVGGRVGSLAVVREDNWMWRSLSECGGDAM